MRSCYYGQFIQVLLSHFYCSLLSCEQKLKFSSSLQPKGQSWLWRPSLRWPALEVELNQVPPFPGISPAGNSSHFPFIFSKWKGMVIGGPWDQTDPSGLDCRGSSLCWFKLAKTQISHIPTDERFLTRVRANLYITPSTMPGRQWPGNSLELSFSFPSW